MIAHPFRLASKSHLSTTNLFFADLDLGHCPKDVKWQPKIRSANLKDEEKDQLNDLFCFVPMVLQFGLPKPWI